jgi:hypothetical protein
MKLWPFDSLFFLKIVCIVCLTKTSEDRRIEVGTIGNEESDGVHRLYRTITSPHESSCLNHGQEIRIKATELPHS